VSDVGFMFRGVLGLFLSLALLTAPQSFSDEQSRVLICRQALGDGGRGLRLGGDERLKEYGALEAGSTRLGDGFTPPTINMSTEVEAEYVSDDGQVLLENGELTHVGYWTIGHFITYRTGDGFEYLAEVLEPQDLNFHRITVEPVKVRVAGSNDQFEAVSPSEQNVTLDLRNLNGLEDVPRYVPNQARLERERNSLDVFEREYVYRPISLNKSEEIRWLNIEIAKVIKKSLSSKSTEQHEAEKNILSIEGGIKRENDDSVAARLRASILTTWEYVHQIRDIKYQMSHPRIGAARKRQLTEQLVVMEERLGGKIQTYNIVYQIVQRLTSQADNTLRPSQKEMLANVMARVRANFPGIPPTHREVLFHANSHRVEVTRLKANLVEEQRRFRRLLFSRVLAPLRTADPAWLGPANLWTRKYLFQPAYDWLNRNLVNRYMVDVLAFEVTYLKLRAGANPQYSQLIEAQVTGGTIPELKDLDMMDHDLFDILTERAGHLDNIDPYIALFRIAMTDTTVDALAKRFKRIAESRGLNDQFAEAETRAQRRGPLAMGSGRAPFWNAVALGDLIRVAIIAGIASDIFGGWGVIDFLIGGREILGIGADYAVYGIREGLETMGFGADQIDAAIMGAQEDLNDNGTLDFSNDPTLSPSPEEAAVLSQPAPPAAHELLPTTEQGPE